MIGDGAVERSPDDFHVPGSSSFQLIQGILTNNRMIGLRQQFKFPLRQSAGYGPKRPNRFDRQHPVVVPTERSGNPLSSTEERFYQILRFPFKQCADNVFVTLMPVYIDEAGQDPLVLQRKSKHNAN